ncbi:ribosomal protein S5 domain 2-like protein [Phellopilus nigrolimitatus]|nr:ribosomal protein S5 domain 2-like protein [Phellopilus nigrolimitatus]
MSTLDSFVTSSTPPPNPLSTSQEIRDRSSTFIGTLYRASSPAAAQRARTYHARVAHGAHPASHEITAWRCMALRSRCDGLRGPEDFELVQGLEDDGEDNGGRRVLRTMEREGVIDAVVIVSRWYGGTLLGPVRFTHIETCTREVCRAFKVIEEVEAIIEELKELDVKLAQLRADLARSSASTTAGTSEVNAPNRTAPDYNLMLLTPVPDLTRAKRLLTARQNAIRSVSGILARGAPEQNSGT